MTDSSTEKKEPLFDYGLNAQLWLLRIIGVSGALAGALLLILTIRTGQRRN